MTNETHLSTAFQQAAELVIELQIEKTKLSVRVRDLEIENEKLARQLEFYKRQPCSKAKTQRGEERENG